MKSTKEKTYARPSWIKQSFTREEELCPTCFRAVGVENRYKIICALGSSSEGITVSELTKTLKLSQPTVTHHLQVLQSVDAVKVSKSGRSRIYTINRSAHCFEDCKIPYKK